MTPLPIPPHFDPDSVGAVWRVPYEQRAREARAWAAEHGLHAAAKDEFRLCLLAVDVQNTFCIPDFELFVAGRSGTGAVDDNRRLCEFIYRNLGTITQIFPSLDTHRAMQIFHPLWLIDEDGNHPEPYTLVSAEDVTNGRWRVNPAVAEASGLDTDYAARHLAYYTRRLADGGKFDLTIWPYHSMLGGIGHALVSAVEEAIFFHSVARHSQPAFQVKGDNPLTEHYSMLGPEVMEGPDGDRLDRLDTELIDALLTFDAVARGRAGEEPLRGVDDRRPDQRRRGERAAARRADLPAGGLHLARGRAGRRRLHGVGGRSVRPLRGGGHERRALDRPDRVVAGRAQRLGDRGQSRIGAILAADLAAGAAVDHHDVGGEVVRAADQR